MVSKSRLIVNALMSGERMSLKEIAEKLSETSGEEVKITDISTFLSKMSDFRKCDLGYFIEKKKEENRFVYKLVDEALVLSEEQVYGLFLKKGKDKYSVDSLLRDYPVLKKYVRENKPKAVRQPRKEKVKKVTAEVHIGKKPVDGKKIEEIVVGMIQKIADLPSGKDIAELSAKIDRIEKSINHLEKNPAKTPNPAPKRKTVLRGGETATNKVLSTIQKAKGGIGFPDIRKKTGFDEKKLRNIINYLKKTGRIRTVRRGVYEST